MAMRRFLGSPRKGRKRRFDGYRIAGMGRRLGCRRSLQLNAAPAGKRVDIQVDAFNIAHAG